MSGISTYFAASILGWVKSTAMPADPAAVYCALYDGDPTDAGSGGSDVTVTIRAAGRVAVTFGAVSAKSIANSADVDFGDADAGADITHYGVWDAATAGNMLFSAELDTPRTVVTSDPVKFATGDLKLDLSNCP